MLMGAVDPFPFLPYQEALHLLRKYFGKPDVRWDQPFGKVTIRLPMANGVRRLWQLTWQQAKYLALNPSASQFLMIGRRPTDWPY